MGTLIVCDFNPELVGLIAAEPVKNYPDIKKAYLAAGYSESFINVIIRRALKRKGF